MAQKYLSEFYTYKVLRFSHRIVADPDTAQEQQIQAHIAVGHQAFFQGKYALALNEYLAAWALLPQLVLPNFPGIVAQIDDFQLLNVEILENLLETSARILQLRDVVDPKVPIVGPVDPPETLIELTKKLTGEFDQARQNYQIGVAYAQAGEVELARSFIEQALQTDDQELQADGKAVLGAIALEQGNQDEADALWQDALGSYAELGRAEGMAAMQHNRGVNLTAMGNAKEAAGLFTAASANLPSTLKGQVTYTSNPGVASISLPMGRAGLPLLLKGNNGAWSQISSSVKGQPKAFANVIRDNNAVQLDLQSGNAIRDTLLQPRVTAQSLEALETYMWQIPQFVAYLAHIRGFVLPLALGDTYFALGDYQKAATYYLTVRDYPFLNRTIERPMVWRKVARTYLVWANRLYRDRDMVSAQQRYENILRITETGFDLSGPLYSGGFADLRPETLNFLNSNNRRGFGAIEFARRLILMEAEVNLTQILNNINYLGFSEAIVPIHSWRYLQNVARYFANQAMQAERAYISFKDKAEQEAFTHLTLEQSIDAQQAALRVENRRVSASLEQRRVAQLSAQLAHTRLNNAVNQRTDYASVSQQLAYLDEIIAFTNASGIRDVRINIKTDWANLLGVEAKKYDPNDLIQLLTRERSRLTRGYELNNMNRRIAEQQAALTVANAQVDVANSMVQVAEAQRALAELRVDQAEALLEHFDAQEFTPELWDNLASAQRELSRRYVDWAIGAAFLMERAFEAEYDIEVNRIRFDYERSELHGLLAADFLLADIDQFSYDRILETEKQIPCKVSIALADRYSFQFNRQFKQTGRIDFETFLDDFDRWQPGAHLRKLKRVEVVVEGLIGPEGLHGTLTNSGISYYRDRQGQRQQRLQKPETMILSRYDLRNDGFVFTLDEDVLAIFENSGVASGWILEIPPESNDIDYRDIANIHLVFYYDAYYNDAVANWVKAELAATAINEQTIGLSLRFQYPDAFFGLQDTGEVTFTIDNAYLPLNHTDPHIRDAYLLVETEAGISNAGLTLQLTNISGIDETDVTDPNGMIFSRETATPLNTLRDQHLFDTWTVRLPAAPNPGLNWDSIRNIFFYVEYRYAPRNWGTPFVDDFATDPLAQFDPIDDPQASVSAPSAWAYDAANQRIRQTSNIHAPAGNANLNSSPNKPGTYFLLKESVQTPALANFVYQTTLNSGDDDGIGLIFRYVDSDNFYFFLMDAQRSFRLLGKKINGAFQLWDVPAVDTANGYTVNQDHTLSVAMLGDACSVTLDGTLILSGRDSDISQPGRVGFYAWNNTNANFHTIRLQALA